MKTSMTLIALAFAIPSIAGAAELKPMQGGSFTLGDHAVSIYYTADDQHYQVVTTIAPEAGTSGAPIRFVGMMKPGQTEVVSIGSFGSTKAPERLELVHTGESLSVVQKIETALAD
ncbi:MAG: hypothetical protein AAGA21_15300 [Pseudomonadota bacterium]